MRVLLVEDDERVSSFVERGLAELGFRVELARDGRCGLELALDGAHELLILDLQLPLLDGNELLRELRRRRRDLPVLVLSARDGVGDRVRVLDAGADDFLVKPFAFEELVARLRALARRPPAPAGSALTLSDLHLDLRSRRVQRAGRAVSLTAKEFALLEFLLRNQGMVVTRAMIAEHVWDQHFGSFSNVIDVYIRYLRAKVEVGAETKLIHTVRGIGYVLAESGP